MQDLRRSTMHSMPPDPASYQRGTGGLGGGARAGPLGRRQERQGRFAAPLSTRRERMPAVGATGSKLITIRPRQGTVQVSRGRTSFVSDTGGEVHRERPFEGLDVFDTRALSRYWRARN